MKMNEDERAQKEQNVQVAKNTMDY
jgi:hypothetical protein